MTFDPFLAAGLVVTAIMAAALGVLALAAMQARMRPPVLAGIFAEPAGAVTFLFDGEALVDATPVARGLVQRSPLRTGSAWTRLGAWLHPRFPGFAETIARLPSEGRIVLTGTGGDASLTLTAELRGGLTRISLVQGDETAGSLAESGMQEELDLLRRATSTLPVPIWREDADGAVVWGNANYLDLALQRLPPGAELEWPLPRLFDRLAALQGARDQRQRLSDSDGKSGHWYELVVVPDGDGRIVHALPADGAVQAEMSLRSFMQTLTKTFAHLRTGLAIFDEARNLALFNPALLDLTGLPPDFLTARPSLAAFFDALRDRSMIPEPRDYRNWRRQMTEMEDAAATGLYEEIWNLPSGQSYRVTGRPHPNGALALMFEDISTEMTRTRRYRADLELGQAVIDTMDEGIAVFSQAGALVMSNAAYSRLWGHDPGATLEGTAAAAALCEHWRNRSAPTTVWDRAEDFIAAMGPLSAWADDVRLTDGRRIACRFARLAGGATLIVFRDDAAAPHHAATLPDEPAPQFASGRRSA
ncbi:MAG: PAS-domain containing protein [Paracoccaceae bacterium]|nr:MAG: PAS-domain containing protein [Paracoccaceae bacterium]